MHKKPYLNLIGLAYRARKCSLGEETIIRDIQEGRAKLVLLANDTGKQTKKKLTDKCHFYNVPLYVVDDDRDTLSKAVGKTDRVAIAILDDGFAKKFKTLLN
ncbi:ribosomal protein L7Ae-like RNA K-turn-binding protein [Cerasibacillus quisquiliarum]|uniref:50S ribosomal protein L7ae n=1 Tax=Cerasibacillus quisquiliarum TaxID=227865 RepID=A0A511UV53_9BACI|nr:YlxQ family RNA-binding protein [Cerasibacillus quisquiliarum]MBB5145896.1 ribosomal protein L7Ae-like RNA K-turn-binding protein [Cerasibacillus quisquiliarum]GEN30467.1 50S ribosomal protein L7ae [Cerasibacillus quisquiliarum]